MSTVYGKIFSSTNLSQSHLQIIKLAGTGKKILELGSASGYLTEQFKKNDNQVDIVEIDPDDAKKAAKFASKVFIGSLEDNKFLESINGTYDTIVAADVLEHLSYPEKVLLKIKKLIKKDGTLIISLPNVACWPTRKDLFFAGKFEYTDTGVLDKTHLRFFTYQTIQKFITSNGFTVRAINNMEIFYPFRNSIKKIPALGALIDSMLKPFFEKNFPNLSVLHMIIIAKNK